MALTLSEAVGELEDRLDRVTELYTVATNLISNSVARQIMTDFEKGAISYREARDKTDQLKARQRYGRYQDLVIIDDPVTPEPQKKEGE